MGIFRLFKGELKKIFLKPGIFIMTGLLALVLTISPKLFNTTNKSLGTSFSGDKVSDRYSYFISQESNIKNNYDENLESQKDIIEEIINESDKNFKQELLALYNNNDNPDEQTDNTSLVYYRNQFKLYVILGEAQQPLLSETITQLNNNIQYMIDSAASLLTLFNTYTSGEVPLLLVTKDNYDDFSEYISKLIIYLNDAQNDLLGTTSITGYLNLDSYLTSSAFIPRSEVPLKSSRNAPINKVYLEKLLNTYYTLAETERVKIEEEIATFISESGNSFSEENCAKIDSLMTSYIANRYNTTKILQNGMLSDISKLISDAELSQYIGFENFNKYQTNEQLAKYIFLLENNQTEYDYASVFAFNQGSNTTENAYDYIFFVIEILSFVIIAYGVMLGAGMIAQEQTNGTLKLLAIRPYNRNKIMFSKMLATLFFVTLFTLAGTLIAFVTGTILYGTASLPILAVFNASTAFVISPGALICIYLISVLIKAWVFVLLAFAISTLFKSYVGATVVSSLLYVITLIVTFVASGASWLKYYVFANLDFFKYFGGSFIINYQQGETLTNLFISPVFNDTTIIFTAIVVVCCLLVLNILTFSVFKRRDIT